MGLNPPPKTTKPDIQVQAYTGVTGYHGHQGYTGYYSRDFGYVTPPEISFRTMPADKTAKLKQKKNPFSLKRFIREKIFGIYYAEENDN